MGQLENAMSENCKQIHSNLLDFSQINIKFNEELSKINSVLEEVNQ